MNRPQEQIVDPRTLAVPADRHDVTATPAWRAARTLRLLALDGDVPAAHRQVAAIARDTHVDPFDVLRHLAEQLANPPAGDPA